jgi:hypothetical protein
MMKMNFYIHLKKIRSTKTITTLFFLSFMILSNKNICYATPMLSQQDPAIIHTIYGTDKFYTYRKKGQLSLHISPYFQHTSNASRGNREEGVKKVPIGNMLGRWNMLGIFFNTNLPTTWSHTNFDQAMVTLQSSLVNDEEGAGKDLTDKSLFNLNNRYDKIGTYKEVDVKYEKIGLRGQISFDFAFGLGFAVKGGVADYKQIPRFRLNDFLKRGKKEEEGEGAGGEDTEEDFTDTWMKPVFDYLMSSNARNAIAKELELDLTEQRKTDIEDIHVSVYWSLPIKKEENGEHILSIVPYFSVGGWLPIGQKKDQNKPFSLSVGNDGFAALTTEGAISFDFPEAFQLGFGVGGSFFTTRDLRNYRVPTSEHQVGIIPWKTSISKRPGPMWYANISLKAENFSPGFSGYFDYVFTEHTKDSIIIKEPDINRKKKFLPEKLERESTWKHQAINAGIKYNITSNLAMGLAVQGTVSSRRAYRSTTILGSLLFAF